MTNSIKFISGALAIIIIAGLMFKGLFFITAALKTISILLTVLVVIIGAIAIVIANIALGGLLQAWLNNSK